MMHRWVVKQAIKDVRTDKVIGHELLFQQNVDDFYGEPENAVADTIANFLMNNSSKLKDDKLMFITFTPSLLFRNTPRIFEKDAVIIQIDCKLVVHPLTLPVVKRFHEMGYKFAINDFQFSPKYFSILEYADYIRIEIKDGMDEKQQTAIENIVKLTKGFGKECIATGVDSKEAYDKAVEMGIKILEGAYIAESMAIRTSKADYMEGNFFQLVVAVAKDEPDMAEIEAIVSRDAGLTYALLKLVNSAFFALRKRTASIRQALVTLGISQMRQWVYMLSFTNDDDERDYEEVLKLSFLRAKFTEELSEFINCDISKSEAYMLGMFSTFDCMVDATLEELLQDIPLDERISAALVSREGILGKLLDLVVAYEKADWKSTKNLAAELGIPFKKLSQVYIFCVEEVNLIWEGLTTDYDRQEELKKLGQYTKYSRIDSI